MGEENTIFLHRCHATQYQQNTYQGCSSYYFFCPYFSGTPCIFIIQNRVDKMLIIDLTLQSTGCMYVNRHVKNIACLEENQRNVKITDSITKGQ